MKFLFILLIPFIVYSQSITFGHGKKLDSLLEKSGKIRIKGINDFIFHQKNSEHPIVLTPPESLFKNIVPENKGITVLQPSQQLRPIVRQFIQSPIGQYVPYSTYISTIQEYDKRINELEVQFAEYSTKTTTILDNLTENSGTTKNFLDLFTKITEILAGLVGVIGGIIGVLKVFKKKRKT